MKYQVEHVKLMEYEERIKEILYFICACFPL